MKALSPVFLAGALFVLLVLTGSARAESLKGEVAPPFDLPTYTGDQQVSLADQRGKIVVLHFGTGW